MYLYINMSASNSGEDPNKDPGKSNEDPGKSNEGPGSNKKRVKTITSEGRQERLRPIGQEIKRPKYSFEQFEQNADELDQNNALDIAENHPDAAALLNAVDLVNDRRDLIYEAENVEADEVNSEILQSRIIQQKQRYEREINRLKQLRDRMTGQISAIRDDKNASEEERRKFEELNRGLEIINQRLREENIFLQQQIETLTVKMQSLESENSRMLLQVEQLNTDFQKLQSDNIEERELATKKSQEDLNLLTATINENMQYIDYLTKELIKYKNQVKTEAETSMLEMQKLTAEKDKQQRLKTDEIIDLNAKLEDTKKNYTSLVNKGAEHIKNISEFQAQIDILKQSTEDCQRQLEECRRQLKVCQEDLVKCEEEKKDLAKNLKKCEEKRLDRGQGPGPNKGPAETILQRRAEEQDIKIEPFMFYDVYYNADRNEFYTKETGVVDIEYAQAYINYKEKDFLIKQQEAYEKAAESKQQKDATIRRPAEVEEVAMVRDKASEEYQQKLRKFFQLLNDKNGMLLAMYQTTSEFLRSLMGKFDQSIIQAVTNFLEKISNLRLPQELINAESNPKQIAAIVNFRLPNWDPNLVSNLFEYAMKQNDGVNYFVKQMNDLPLKKGNEKIGTLDKQLTRLYSELFPPGKDSTSALVLEPGKDPLADLYSFLDAKDLDYLEETSAFISDFRSKINDYYTVSSRIIDTSEQFIRQMTFIGLEDENEQSVSYNARLKNVSKLNTIEYLDEIGSKEDQITAIYYIICKVVSQEEEVLGEDHNLERINQAILTFDGANFEPIVSSLPPPICEKIRDSIVGLCKNSETCGEEIIKVLGFLDNQIPGGLVLGQGQRQGESSIEPNKFIIKVMNAYFPEKYHFDPNLDLQLSSTGRYNNEIKEKLRKLKSDNITIIKENINSKKKGDQTGEYTNFSLLLDEVEKEKEKGKGKGKGTDISNVFTENSQGFSEVVSESDYSQNSQDSTPSKYDSSSDEENLRRAPIKKLNYALPDPYALSESETELVSDKTTPLKNKPTAGGSKIIQKGGIAFPFSSAYFTLPDQRPENCNTEDCRRYYDADGSKKPNVDRIFQYDLITIVLQILLYADSMHDFKGELNKIRKDVLVNNIFDAFNRLYNIINKPGVNDYNTIRKCIECLKPEIANMLNNFKSKASEEWGGYESVIAYRYTQDIGLSELTILKYIYINPNDLDDPSNFFDKDTLIQLGREGFIFCSSTSTPGDTKVEIGDDWYNFFVLMNVDGSPVMPTPVDAATIKSTMRAYEDNPISKDILAYLFGISPNADPATSPEVSNGLLRYKMISKASEDQMSRLLKDNVSNESISNESIPGNSDPSNQAQSIVYESLNNTRTANTIAEVDNEKLKLPDDADKIHPNGLLISSMQTFLDVYASAIPANRIQIRDLTKITSPTDPSKYIGVQIETNPPSVTHPYKLLLTSTSIESIQGIVAKLFNDKTIQYGPTLDINNPEIAALNATLNPLQKEIMNLAIMYYNNMHPKFKVGSPDDRKNIFMSCVLMWKAFGDYWEVTYVYGLDYMNLGDLINKYLITSTDKNVAFMEFWLGLFGIIAKTSIHLPEAYEAVSVTKDTSDQVSLDVDEENFIKKQMGEGMILNVLPKSKDEFLNIKKLKADLMSIADRWAIIKKSEDQPMEVEGLGDPSLLAQFAPIDPIQENIRNIDQIKGKYKPIERDSSITAFSYLMQNIPDADNKQKLSDHINTEIIKNDENIKSLKQKIHEMSPSLEAAQKFDKDCFNVLDSDNLKDPQLKESINNILERRRESNSQIINECQMKIDSNVAQIDRKSQELVTLVEPDEATGKAAYKTYEKNKQKLEYDIFKLERNTRSNQTKLKDNEETVSKIDKIHQKINDLSKKLLPDDINQIKAITRKEMRDNNLLKKQAGYITLNAELINSQNEKERLEATLQQVAPPLQVPPDMIRKVMRILKDEKTGEAGSIIDAFNAIRTLLDIKTIQERLLGPLGQTSPFASVDALNRYFESIPMDQEKDVDVVSDEEKEKLKQILGNSYQEIKKIPFILDFNPAVMVILPSKTITDIQTMSSDLNESYYNKIKKEILAEGYDESSVVTQNKILLLGINHQLFLTKCDLLRSEYEWATTNFGPIQGQSLSLAQDQDLLKYTIPLKEFNDQMTIAGFQCVSLLADLQETIDFNKTKSQESAAKISQLNDIARQKDEFLTNFKNGNFTSSTKINEAATTLLTSIKELVEPYKGNRSMPFKLPLRNIYNDLKTKYGQESLRIDPNGFEINWFLFTLDYFIDKFGNQPNSEDYKAICYLLSNFSIAKKADAVEVQTKIDALLNALDRITVGANLTILNKELYDAFTDLVNVDDSDLQEIFSSEQNTGVRKQKFLKQIQEFKDDADNKKELQRQKEAADAAKELAKQQKAAEKAAKDASKSKGLLSKIGSAVKKGVTTVTTVISDKITSVTDKIEAVVAGKSKKEVDYELVTKAQQASLKELVGPIVKALMPFQKRSPAAIANYFATASNKIESNLTSYRENYINKMDNCLKELLMSSNISDPSSILARGGRKTKRKQKHKYTKKLKHDKPKKKKYTHHTKLRIAKRLTKKYKNNQKAKKKRNTKRGHSSLSATSMPH